MVRLTEFMRRDKVCAYCGEQATFFECATVGISTNIINESTQTNTRKTLEVYLCTKHKKWFDKLKKNNLIN